MEESGDNIEDDSHPKEIPWTARRKIMDYEAVVGLDIESSIFPKES